MALRQNVILAPFTNYKIGGPARYFLEFNDENDLIAGLNEWQEAAKTEKIKTEKIFILGSGTNLLFSDKGFDGLVMRNTMNLINKLSDNRLEVGSAVTFQELNDYCIRHSLSGLEWSGGLPGTLGGAVFGNAGAFGGETKDNIITVQSYKVQSYKVIERSNAECEFEYRNSIFKAKLRNEEIILSAVLQFSKGDKEKICQSVQEKIDYRESRQPLQYPSAGSTFKNIDLKYCSKELIKLCETEIKSDPFPVIPIAFLIYKAGLAGKKIGDVMISPQHPNFFINLGDGTANDVQKLIALTQKTIHEKFGVTPEPEIRIIE